MARAIRRAGPVGLRGRRFVDARGGCFAAGGRSLGAAGRLRVCRQPAAARRRGRGDALAHDQRAGGSGGCGGDFDSFCTTLRIEGRTPDGVNLYLSAFNGTLNGLTYYGGIQTHIDGHGADGSFVRGGRGAIFSRWRERDTAAISRAPGGLVRSSGHEGDFISVRNGFAWDEGRYRLCLLKSGGIAGDPLPENHTAQDIAFAWGRYAHTWVRMEATDLDTGRTSFIGALAVPGTALALRRHNVMFAEIYGAPNPFPAARVPDIAIVVEDFSIDGRVLSHGFVTATSNPMPGRADAPKMTRVRYDAAERAIRIELGRFTGRFGVLRTAVAPSRPAVESASLVSADGEEYVLALRDGQRIGRDELPSGRLNLRADPVDAGRVGSMRLSLGGAVSLSRLTNEAPYRLGGDPEGLSLPPGDYRFTATPYAQADGQGTQGTSFVAAFSVVAATGAASFQDRRLLAHVEAALGTTLSRADAVRELGRLERLVVRPGEVADLGGLEFATNLRTLSLPGNRIVDIAALSGLGRLEELDLSGNAIGDIAPLGRLPRLRRLEIRDNAIVDAGPLAGLAALESIDIGGNAIASLEPLAGLAALRRLDAAGNAVRDLTPLAGLVHLEALDISANRVADLAPLAGLIGLRALAANANAVDDLAPLAGLTGLRNLAVSGNPVTDLGSLAGLQHLARLKADLDQVAGLQPLFALNGLKRLELTVDPTGDPARLAGLQELNAQHGRSNDGRDSGPLDASMRQRVEIIGIAEPAAPIAVLSLRGTRQDRD